MSSSVAGLTLVLLLAGVPEEAASADAAATPAPLLFLADPRVGMEAGVVSVSSMRRLIGSYDRFFDGVLTFDESRPLSKAAGILTRATKATLVDIPLRGVAQVVTHEVFGHGSRGRESGRAPYYEFRLPFPYGRLFGAEEGASTGYAHAVHSGNPDYDIQMGAGGVESDYLTAWWINANLVQQSGRLAQGEMLAYATSKLTYSPELRAAATAMGKDGNDISAYVLALQDQFNLPGPEGRDQIARRLQTAYLWNFVDPTFWLSTYHWLVTHLFHGHRHAELTMPTWRSLRLWPGTRFNLTPFGAEHYLELFGAKGGSWGNAYARVGSSGLAPYWGGGFSVRELPLTRHLRLGGELDLWSQPQLTFENRFVFDREQRQGGSLAALGTVQLSRHIGLVAKLGYKTRGYLMGQPLNQGLYGYAGVAVALPEESGKSLPQ